MGSGVPTPPSQLPSACDVPQTWCPRPYLTRRSWGPCPGCVIWARLPEETGSAGPEPTPSSALPGSCDPSPRSQAQGHIGDPTKPPPQPCLHKNRSSEVGKAP